MTKTAALSDVLARIDADFDKSSRTIVCAVADQVDFGRSGFC